MVWVQSDYKYGLLQQFCMFLLKFGPIPKHIGFIMDGNRRFASTNHMRTTDGHVHGFSKLSQVLRWCKDMGVRELTVYAFSVENFKRSSDEVSFLFDLAGEKLQELLDKLDELHQNGVCIRLIGNMSMLPTRIQRLASELMLRTRENKKSILNVCMAYGTQEELTESIERIRLGVRDNLIHPDDINPDLLGQCLYTRRSRPLDLIVRTSGEVRLSDFLVWQAAQSGSVHKFVCSYWPTFSLWNFLAAIFHYQLAVVHLARTENPDSDPLLDDECRLARVQRFLDRLDHEYWTDLARRASGTVVSDQRTVQRSIGDSLPL